MNPPLLARLFGRLSYLADRSCFGTLYTVNLTWRGRTWLLWQRAVPSSKERKT